MKKVTQLEIVMISKKSEIKINQMRKRKIEIKCCYRNYKKLRQIKVMTMR